MAAAALGLLRVVSREGPCERRSSLGRTQYKWKDTSTVVWTGTGVIPSFIAGLKRQVFTASMAFSSKLDSRLLTTCTFCGIPLLSTTRPIRQVPCTLFFFAYAE